MLKANRRIENDNLLNCRFCGNRENTCAGLYETSPIRGIVCINCLTHLMSYIDIDVSDTQLS